MDPIVLDMASRIQSSCYIGTNALTCLLDQLTVAFGGPALMGVLAGATIFGVFYVAADRSLATPTVALILTGTVLTAMVPQKYVGASVSLVMIGLAVAMWQVYRQYASHPSLQ